MKPILYEDLQFYIQERRRRGLSQDEVAAELNAPRSALANIEVRRVLEPREPLNSRFHALVERWKAELGVPVLLSHVHEERGIYLADVQCPKCQKRVPGPDQDAMRCLVCGFEFPVRKCPQCKARNPERAAYCMGCGGRL